MVRGYFFLVDTSPFLNVSILLSKHISPILSPSISFNIYSSHILIKHFLGGGSVHIPIQVIQNLFTKLSFVKIADYSIVVTTSCLDLNQFSRKREFVFKPPRVWPLNLGINSSQLMELNELDKHAIIVVYDNEEFIVNRVSTYFVLNSEVNQCWCAVIWIFLNIQMIRNLEWSSRISNYYQYSWKHFQINRHYFVNLSIKKKRFTMFLVETARFFTEVFCF